MRAVAGAVSVDLTSEYIKYFNTGVMSEGIFLKKVSGFGFALRAFEEFLVSGFRVTLFQGFRVSDLRVECFSNLLIRVICVIRGQFIMSFSSDLIRT